MINILEKQAARLPGINSLFISTGYNPEVVEVIKGLSERDWNKESKEWEIPIHSLSDILKRLMLLDSIQLTLQKDKRVKGVDIPSDYRFKLQPYRHQLEGIQYALEKNSFILGDDQGLGKTFIIIHTALILKQQEGLKHCLIICGKNNLKYTWASEIQKHSDSDYFILGERTGKRSGKKYIGSLQDRLDDLKSNPSQFFLITNIETLRDDKIIKELNKKKLGIEMIVIDEAHVIKDPSSQQGRNILKLTKFKRKIPVSGTILLNGPLETYVPLKWTDNEHSTYTYFKARYCIYDGSSFYQVIGYKHLDELHEQLSQCMLRRMKSEVLDLPPKIYSFDYVEMNPKQQKIYEDVQEAIREDIDRVKLSKTNLLAAVTRLRQATSYTGILSTSVLESAKLDRLEDLVEQIVSQGDKVIVYTCFKETAHEVQRRFMKYGAVLATGEFDDYEIEDAKSQLMTNDSCKVMIATWQKMGAGHTLTAASYVIFVDTPWTNGDLEQCIDRVHRIGTIKTINIITLITKDTFDERVRDIVEGKAKLFKTVVDGEIEVADPASFLGI